MISTRQTIACILLIAGITVCGYAQTTPAKEITSTISGKVTVQGNAVQGVIITLRSNESRKLLNQRGVTNANGEYRMTNVPAGSYTVLPAAASFVAASGSNGERTVIISQAETIEDFDFSLLPGGVITGKVVDPDGVPVVEEEIHLFPARDYRILSPYPTAVTDDRGVYRIFGLKPGVYKVAAGRDDDTGSSRQQAAIHSRTFYPSSRDFAEATVLDVREGTEATNIDITVGRMLTTYSASGRIVDGATGQPLPNVRYGFIHYSPTSTRHMRGRAVTNERGEFKLEDLAPGQYKFNVSLEPGSYVHVEEVRFEIVDQDITGLVIKSIAGASLSGVLVLDGTYDKEIRDKFRKTELNAFVRTEASPNSAIGVPAAVDQNGIFKIGGLPGGNATFGFGGPNNFRIIRVERDGIVLPPRNFELKSGEDLRGFRIVAGYSDASLSGAVQIRTAPSLPTAGFL